MYLKSWASFGLLLQRSIETTIREHLQKKQASQLNIKCLASNLLSVLFPKYESY